MIFVGVDGGKKGGIVVLSDKGNIIMQSIMPIHKGKKAEYDIAGISDIFKRLKEEHSKVNVFLEKALILPVSGRISIASTSFCNGVIQGVLTALNISYQIISSKEWQKEVLKGLNQTDTKQASIMFCQRKFPDADFRATTRAVKVSDGLTDATCIAYYGFLLYDFSKKE